MPTFSFVSSLVSPTPKSAMGFVGFYEENLSLYTFLGDHSYFLAFPGDTEFFHIYAKRLGLDGHKVSETEYSEDGRDWQRKLIFDTKDKIRSIQYSSSSQ